MLETSRGSPKEAPRIKLERRFDSVAANIKSGPFGSAAGVASLRAPLGMQVCFMRPSGRPFDSGWGAVLRLGRYAPSLSTRSIWGSFMKTSGRRESDPRRSASRSDENADAFER